jgi:hypothetical protein
MDVREEIKAYLDGELPAPEADRVREAIERDPEMSKLAAEFQAVGEALSGMKRDYEPVGLEETLAALDAERTVLVLPSSRKKSYSGYWIGLGLAAGLAAVFAAPSLFRQPTMTGSFKLASNRAPRADDAKTDMARPQFGLSAPSQKQFQDRMVRPPQNSSDAKTAPTAAPAAAAAAKPALASPVELLKQNQELKDENARLKKQLSGRDGAVHLPTQKQISGDLPMLPPIHSDFNPSPIDGDKSPSLQTPPAGAPPAKVASLEKSVRAVVASASGTIEKSSGQPQLRVLTISVPAGKASALQKSLKSTLKEFGRVSVAPQDDSKEMAANQAVRDKIHELNIQRDQLLETYLPEAPAVKDLDEQIKKLQAQIVVPKSSLRTLLNVVIG